METRPTKNRRTPHADAQSNVDQVVLYLQKKGLDFTADNVVEAVWALHGEGRILWAVDPVAVSPAEAARRKRAEDAARMAAEDAKFKPGLRHVNDLAADNTRIADKGKNDVEAKALAQTKSEITREINSYFKGSRFGLPNYAATESGQAKLKAAAGSYLQLASLDEAKRVLQHVRSVKQQLS